MLSMIGGPEMAYDRYEFYIVFVILGYGIARLSYSTFWRDFLRGAITEEVLIRNPIFTMIPYWIVVMIGIMSLIYLGWKKEKRGHTFHS